MDKFSVLMSVYLKENPEFLRLAIDSIVKQTIMPNQVVIVKDGPLTPELDGVIDEFNLLYPGLFKIVSLETNRGLGLALREGVIMCDNELIARMDSDDISRSDRFELQLKEFMKDPALDICGSHVLEFEVNIENIVAKRIVPIEDEAIKKYQKRRDGFNHVSVMFKKSAVLRAGNYQSCLLMEDTLLWVNIFLSGAKAVNIDDYLVFVRIGKDMFERRGGFSYYKKYKSGRKQIYKTGYISWWDYRYTLLVQFAVALMPNKLRGWIFKKLLHR